MALAPDRMRRLSSVCLQKARLPSVPGTLAVAVRKVASALRSVFGVETLRRTAVVEPALPTSSIAFAQSAARSFAQALTRRP